MAAVRAQRQRLGGWRKLAGAYWGPPSDPQFYGDLDVDAQAVLDYIDQSRQDGVRLTPTHLVVRAVAHALAAEPSLNGRLHRGYFVPRDSVDVFVIAATQGGRELTGVKVEHADVKSAGEVAAELQARVEAIESREDVEFGRTKRMLDRVPAALLRPAMRLAAWAAIDRDWDLRGVGLPSRQTFGSAMVTSVGMFGVDHAYSALSPFYRVPFLILVGKITPRPVAVHGSVVVRPILPMTGTVDHRYVDGYQAAQLAERMREYLRDPAAFEPAPGRVPAPRRGGRAAPPSAGPARKAART